MQVCRSCLQNFLLCLISAVADLQVCSYRCIVSHESQLLEDFSLCVLQKHNCLGKSAEIPVLPDPPPMDAFRGDVLTHELAESLFIGWLGGFMDPTSVRDAREPIRLSGLYTLGIALQCQIW